MPKFSLVFVALIFGLVGFGPCDPPVTTPPPAAGYFSTLAVGATLPTGADCTNQVHRSTWEPRPDNNKRNRVLVDPNAVHASFSARPYDSSWRNWNTTLQRVDGQFQGTTDEIFQWGACKWGLSDNVLRAVAVNESTWFQYETYPSNRCVFQYSCGDIVPNVQAKTTTYCNHIDTFGYAYQPDYSPGICPETFSIVGIKSYEDPAWGPMANNQNGTFPFSRNSTAFAVDYIGHYLRGCYNGDITWLGPSGDIWGCVGSWFSGDWHDPDGNAYIAEAQSNLNDHVWLDASWPNEHPNCHPTYGCPGPDTL